MFLVTGSTGNIGGEAIRLLAKQQPVRVLVHSRQKTGILEGAESVEGDFDSPETLIAALDGIEGALLVVVNSPRQAERAFIDAARAAGVRHIVAVLGFLPSLNSPVRYARAHAEGIRHLERSGVPFTVLRPNMFIQNLLTAVSEVGREGRLTWPLDDATAGLIDTRDIAAVAVAALLHPAPHLGRTHFLTGPEALSFAEVTRRLSTTLSKTVVYADVSLDAFRDSLLASGADPWIVGGLVETFAGIRDGDYSPVTNTVTEITGRPPVTFDRFARDHAAAFKAAAEPKQHRR